MRWISANNPREMPDSPGFGIIREPGPGSAWYSGPVSRTLPNSPFLSIAKPSISTVPYHHWSYSSQPTVSAASHLCRTYEYAPLEWTHIRSSNGTALPTFSGGNIVRSRSYYQTPTTEYRSTILPPVGSVIQRETMQSYPSISTVSDHAVTMGSQPVGGGSTTPMLRIPSPIMNKLPPLMMHGLDPNMYPSSHLPPLFPRQHHEPAPLPPRPSPLLADRPPLEASYNVAGGRSQVVSGQYQPWWMEGSHPTLCETSAQPQGTVFQDSERPIRVQNAFAQQYVNGAVRHRNESEIMVDDGHTPAHRLRSHAARGSLEHCRGFDESAASSFDRQYNHSRMQRSERKRDVKQKSKPPMDNEYYVSSKFERNPSMVSRRRQPHGGGCCSNARAGNTNFEMDYPRDMRRKSSSCRKQFSGQQIAGAVPQIIHAVPKGVQGGMLDPRDSAAYGRPQMDNAVQHQQSREVTPVRSRLLSYKNYLKGSEYNHHHDDGHIPDYEHPREDRRGAVSHSPPYRFKSFDGGLSHQDDPSHLKRHVAHESSRSPYYQDDEPEGRRTSSHYINSAVVGPPAGVKRVDSFSGDAAPLLPKRCDLSDLSVLTSASGPPPHEQYRSAQNGRLCSRHEKQTMDVGKSTSNQRSSGGLGPTNMPAVDCNITSFVTSSDADMLCNPIERIRWLEHTVDILSVFLRSLLKAAKVNSAGALIELVREIGKDRSSKSPQNYKQMNSNSLNVPEKLHDFHGSPSAVSTVSYGGVSESAGIPGSYAMSEDEALNNTDPNHLLKILKLIEEVVSSLDIPPRQPQNTTNEIPHHEDLSINNNRGSTDHNEEEEEEELSSSSSHPNTESQRRTTTTGVSSSSSSTDDPSDEEEHLDITPSDDETSTPMQVDMLNPSSSEGISMSEDCREEPHTTSLIPNLPLTTVGAGAWMTGNVTAGDTYFEE